MSDDRLRLLVERIERLLEERKGITDDISDVYSEAKAVGYDASTIRKLIARRAMKPDDRAEADQALAVYEAALGMGEAQPALTIADLRPDAAALAVNLLAEQIVGLEDPEQAAALIEHVMFLIDLRAEISELRTQEGDRKKQAKAGGFDPNQMGLTVRWFEKCAKHGEDAMRAGEATFQLYRSTVEQREIVEGDVTADPQLQRLFAPTEPKAPTKRLKSLNTHRAAAEMAQRALRGDI